MRILGQPLNRRTLLRGVGTAIALPMLDAMMARGIAADSKAGPLRLAFLYVPNGKHMPFWTPDKVGTDYDIKPTLAPVAHLKQSINLLTGLTLEALELTEMAAVITLAVQRLSSRVLIRARPMEPTSKTVFRSIN